jgi:hypothetical protein
MLQKRVVLGVLAVVLAAAVGCNPFKRKPADEPVTAQADAELVPDIPEPDGGLAEPVAEAESTAAADAILEQMKTGGLQAGEFKKTGAKYSAKACIEGVLDTIPTLLCEYESPEQAKASKDQAVEYAKGSPTGVVDRNGRTVLALKSDKTLDKNGEKANRIITQFNKAK